jgi:hypothetical protein
MDQSVITGNPCSSGMFSCDHLNGITYFTKLYYAGYTFACNKVPEKQACNVQIEYCVSLVFYNLGDETADLVFSAMHNCAGGGSPSWRVAIVLDFGDE